MINIIEFLKSLPNQILGKDRTSIRGRLAFSISWALIGSVFSRSLVMGANILFGRILGADQLGELGIILNTVTVFCTIASSGISQGITKYIAELRSTNPKNIIGYINTGLILEIGLGLAGVGVLFAFSPLISKSLSTTTNITAELVLFAFTILFISINNVQIAALSGFEKFDSIALINGIRGILILALGVIGSLVYQVKGTLIGLELAEMITMLISFVLLNKFIHFSQSYTETSHLMKEPLQKLVKFGVPSMLGSVVTMAAFWYCSLLLVRYSDYGSMGIFNAADKWKQILVFIPAAVSPTILPILSSLSLNKENYRKVYRANIFLNMGIILFPTLIMVIFSKFAMGLYGKEFTQGNRILVLLCLASIFSVLNNVIGQSLISLGAINTRTVLDIFLSILVVGCGLLFIPSNGAEGLALAYLIGYFLTAILVLLVTQKMLKQKGLI